MTFLYQYKATISYIGLIVLVNSLFSYLPFWQIFGQTMSPADIAVGTIYIARDFSQREIKSYVLLAMLVGGMLSYFCAENTVAFASICAFFVGEFIDWILFTYTKKPLSQRLLLSSLCSCPIDTLVFLALISHLNWLEFSMMNLFKFLGIYVVYIYWKFHKRSTCYPEGDTCHPERSEGSHAIDRDPSLRSG